MTGTPLRTQVGIVGAGPAGLLLSQLLARQGIDSVIVENRSREYIEARIRAGVLEQQTIDLLTEAGVGERMHREGLRHNGIYLQWPGERHQISFPELCGRSVMVYGQTEVVKDLVEARIADGQALYFEVSGTRLENVTSDAPEIHFVDAQGVEQTVVCDLIAGCDGFHGVSRQTIPEAIRTTWERVYPFSWLGILADVPPSTDELIYAWHPDGFAMHSMRSTTRSRLYIQVDPTEKIEDWSDDRIWTALSQRLALPGWNLQTGPVVDKGITPMRSFVSAPMRYGNLFLAGDAAHIVPPTGAKGLNLAVADIKVLSDAIIAKTKEGRTDLLEAYSDTALRRVWRATHFSWWMTSMLHVSSSDPFDHQLQMAQLRYVTSSTSAAAGLAENYTGMPFEA